MQISLLAALAGILFGYDTGVISGAILFIDSSFSLTATTNGIVVSAVLIGAFFGSFASGKLSDRYGRRKLLIWDAQIFIVGTLWSSIAVNIEHLILARIIVGIAIGIASYTAPLYIAEIAPADKRGAMVSCNQLAIAVGILISYIVDYALADAGNWRLMLGLGVVPALALWIAMIKLPESPRWLLMKHKNKEALDILIDLRKNTQVAQSEVKEIKQTLSIKQGNWTQLFRSPFSKALMIGVGLSLIQQVTGINTILYYAPTIFTLSGVASETSAILTTMGIGVLFVLVSALAIPLVDIVGRKPLLYFGLILMALSLCCMSLGQQQILLAGMFCYIIGFGISLGPIAWLMIAEVFPLHLRGVGCSIATGVNWAANGLVAMSFLSLIEWLEINSVFLLYAVLTMVSLIFVYRFVPETKSCSLEQLETNLNAGVPARLLGSS